VFINPLHVLFSTDRGRASPYQPSDRRFLDPIYLNVGALGEGLDATRARALFAASAAQFIDASMSERVQYRAVWAAKQGVLERRFDDFADTMNDKAPSLAVDAFARYVAAGGAALRRFAIFEAIAETFPGQSWRQWPDGLADVDSTAVEEFAREHRHRVRFHQYLQYLCDAQFGAAAAAGKAAGIGVGVVRDLAIGASPDGAEVWTQPDLFVKGVSVGAPPDPLAPEGQIWGLPPMNPHGLRVAGFAPFADLLSANMRHAGGLRIDHAMGLKRLFWVPDGAKGEDGAYIDYPFRDLRAQTTLQSRRSECMVVGEDLGTVPPDFREPMAEAGIQGYRVLLLERNGVGFNPSSWYPAQSVACISTHDLPTFCGWWDGEDLKERHLLGMPGSADLNGALAIRETEKTKLAEMLVAEKLIEGPADTAKTAELMMPAAHAFVAGSPAALVAVQADDLAAERIAVNLPGTSNERPNWRRKLDISVPGLLRRQGAQAVLDAVRKARSAVKPTGEDS
jgi:glycogen operon protein